MVLYQRVKLRQDEQISATHCYVAFFTIPVLFMGELEKFDVRKVTCRKPWRVNFFTVNAGADPGFSKVEEHQ